MTQKKPAAPGEAQRAGSFRSRRDQRQVQYSIAPAARTTFSKQNDGELSPGSLLVQEAHKRRHKYVFLGDAPPRRSLTGRIIPLMRVRGSCVRCRAAFEADVRRDDGAWPRTCPACRPQRARAAVPAPGIGPDVPPVPAPGTPDGTGADGPGAIVAAAGGDGVTVPPVPGRNAAGGIPALDGIEADAHAILVALGRFEIPAASVLVEIVADIRERAQRIADAAARAELFE